MMAGTDMRGEDWTAVLSDILQFAETKGEHEFAGRLMDNGLFDGRRMPVMDVKFVTPADGGEHHCDYYWPDQEIMYFSFGQEKSRDVAEKAGIKCIYGPDGYTETVEKIIKGMK